MRKGTKQIRKVFNGEREYYVFDLDADINGKRKRIYGSSPEEVEKKVQLAKEEQEKIKSVVLPNCSTLSDYVKHYFKISVGRLATTKINRLLTLFMRNVFDSEIDKNVEELTKKDFMTFYYKLCGELAHNSVVEIDEVIKEALPLAGEKLKIDMQEISVPDNNVSDYPNSSKYILSPSEYEDVLKYCIVFAQGKFKTNARTIVFALLSGIRATEATIIKAADLNLEEKKVKVGEKTVSLTDDCVQWLKEQIECGLLPNTDDDGYLFSVVHGKPVTRQSVSGTVKAIVKRRGLPIGVTGVNFHKSFIIYHTSAGVSVDALSKQLQSSVLYIKETIREYNIQNHLT